MYAIGLIPVNFDEIYYASTYIIPKDRETCEGSEVVSKMFFDF
jgi:hypothetical protein